MSAREWKPGDVAMVAFIFEQGTTEPELSQMDDRGCWRSIRGHRVWSHLDESIASVSPVVPMDPDDQEQIDEFCKALVEGMHLAGDTINAAAGIHPNSVVTALRKLLEPTPPKPDEPTGLGAVVVDANDVRWVRMPYEFSKDAITAVRVLSEGVTPDA